MDVIEASSSLKGKILYFGGDTDNMFRESARKVRISASRSECQVIIDCENNIEME